MYNRDHAPLIGNGKQVRNIRASQRLAPMSPEATSKRDVVLNLGDMNAEKPQNMPYTPQATSSKFLKPTPLGNITATPG